jgi:hypothetical protein
MGLEVPPGYDPKARVRLSILRDDLSSRWVERFRANNSELAELDTGSSAGSSGN